MLNIQLDFPSILVDLSVQCCRTMRHLTTPAELHALVVSPLPKPLGQGSDRCQRLRRSQRLLWRCRYSRILRDVSARRRSEHASRVGCPWP